VIAIAHRLFTIARMDHLIVLEAGRIVKQGTHEDLLRLDGLYEKLLRRQSGLPRGQVVRFGSRGTVALGRGPG